MNQFYVLQCPKCGLWGVKEVRKLSSSVFHCKYCQKMTKLKQKKLLGIALNHKLCNYSREASIYCRDLNNKKEIGFETYGIRKK